MIDRQISNEISGERERDEKHSRAVGFFFFSSSFRLRPHATAVYQCTKPIFNTSVDSYYTSATRGYGFQSSRTCGNTRRCTGMSGVDLRDSVVRPPRSRTQKEQRVLSQCDSLMPPPDRAVKRTRAHHSHTPTRADARSTGARCRWRARCHGDGGTTAQHLANKEGSRNVATRTQNKKKKLKRTITAAVRLAGPLCTEGGRERGVSEISPPSPPP